MASSVSMLLSDVLNVSISTSERWKPIVDDNEFTVPFASTWRSASGARVGPVRPSISSNSNIIQRQQFAPKTNQEHGKTRLIESTWRTKRKREQASAHSLNILLHVIGISLAMCTLSKSCLVVCTPTSGIIAGDREDQQVQPSSSSSSECHARNRQETEGRWVCWLTDVDISSQFRL